MLWSCRSGPSDVRSSSKQDGALAADEELLQREDLAAIAERVLREQPEFGERIEDDAGRVDFFHRGEDLCRGLDQVDLGRVIHGDLRFAVEIGFFAR